MTLCLTPVQELVTLGALAQGRADPHKNTATHLTPVEFHKELQAAQAQCESAHSNGDSSLQEPSSVTSSKEVVLLDARNAYETAIGHFKAVSAWLPLFAAVRLPSPVQCDAGSMAAAARVLNMAVLMQAVALPTCLV
jgi:predicted sulfurtransferase